MPIVLPSVGSVTSSGQSLPTVQVYDYLYNSGDPTATKPASLANAVVRITLQYDSGNTTTPSIVHLNPGQIIVTADANGFWSANLIPNDIITPANTVYMVKTPFDTFQISVTSTPAVQQASQIIVNTPAPLSPAATGLVGPITVTGNLTVTGASSLAGGTLTGSYALPDGGALDTTGLKVKGGIPWYDVKAFGAAGNGVTNDTAAFQSALDAARVAGGGIVYIPPGTYLLNATTTVTGFATGCLSVGSNVVVLGAGMDSVTLKPGNLNIDGVFINYNGTGNGSGAGNTNIQFRDFTIDCSNQTGVNHGDGFHLATITRCRWQRVRVYNLYGNGFENAAWDLFFGSHLYLDDCEVDTTRSGSSGFGMTQCTSSELNRCKAKGVVYRAFLCDYSSGIKYVNCHNYLGNSAAAQFDVTGAIDVEYVNCTAGGYATTTGGGVAGPSLPYTSGQNLGNVGSGPGFNVANAGSPSRINYIGCLAAGNAGNGFMIQFAASVRIVGGGSINNAIGYWLPTTAIAGATRITGGPVATGNVTAPLQVNAVNYATIEGGVAGPAVPATGVYIQNPFPFDANVWVTGGTVTSVLLASNGTGGNGVQLGGATPVSVRVPVGAFIGINYTVAPTWNWWVD